MKTVIIAMAIIAASVAPAFATSDGDHSVRPRPEFRGVQAKVLRAPRNPVDATMRLGYETTTTNFGWEPRLSGMFDQIADYVDTWYLSETTERP